MRDELFITRTDYIVLCMSDELFIIWTDYIVLYMGYDLFITWTDYTVLNMEDHLFILGLITLYCIWVVSYSLLELTTLYFTWEIIYSLLDWLWFANAWYPLSCSQLFSIVHALLWSKEAHHSWFLNCWVLSGGMCWRVVQVHDVDWDALLRSLGLFLPALHVSSWH